jgi:hypothetical protein
MIRNIASRVSNVRTISALVSGAPVQHGFTPFMRYKTNFTAQYAAHVKEREAMGIVPTPLNADWTALVVSVCSLPPPPHPPSLFSDTDTRKEAVHFHFSALDLFFPVFLRSFMTNKQRWKTSRTRASLQKSMLNCLIF